MGYCWEYKVVNKKKYNNKKIKNLFQTWLLYIIIGFINKLLNPVTKYTAGTSINMSTII
jgi:hypothetical protein